MKRKSLFLILIVLMTLAVAFSLLTACDEDTPGSLSNEYGARVEGGSFPEGSTLVTTLIDEGSSEGKSALEAIKNQEYDKDGKVYVFDISVEADGVKIQPDGKVKVSVPVSADLTGYDVLHIKDGGSVERLALTYQNGIATFETDSFSKFVFVKKATPAIGDDDKGNIDDGKVDDDKGNVDDGKGDIDESATKYTVYPLARRIVSSSFSEGGAVRDAQGEYITFCELSLAEGTEYTLYSHCYPDYYFLGWYEASDRDEATEENLLSTDDTYTFTVSKDIDICALYAYKTDPVEFTIDANYHGFSYKDGKPTLTLVSSSEDGDKPYHKSVVVRPILADGSTDYYGTYSSDSKFKMKIVDGDNNPVDELDYMTVGRYTITYYSKYNENINTSLEVEVVDSANRLYVSTRGDKKFYFGFNGNRRLTGPLSKIFPEGRLITLTAQPADNYAFLGWYEGKDLVSTDLVYCFEMPDREVMLYGEYTYTNKYLEFSVPYGAGELLDSYGNEYIGNKKIYYTDSLNTNLTVRENSNYEFLGWYDVTGGKSELLTENKKLNVSLDSDSANMSVEASFREKLRYIELGSDTLSNECIVNGKIGFAIGDTAIDYNNFTIKAKGAAGTYKTLSASDYTIDGTVDFNTAGTYTVTYTYKYDTSVKTQVQIVVINPNNAEFTFEKGYSYLNHEFDGKATFIALQDVEVDGIALYNFKSTSTIWNKLSYKWVDKASGEEVDTTDVDITINGTIVKDFGPENYKRTIGNEFCGPIKAGSYRFELAYDGTTVLTQDSTISTQTYKKITGADELKSNEGSTWVNFELYYYTIIAQADNGKYYVMQMPSIGSGTETEAREISVDANGNAIVGADNDFAFAYVRYIAGYENSLEFMTGYYGSYVSRTSGSTVDGTLFGSPYIYRTGYTYISDGKISREYGNKENYGMSITFADNGAVTIHSNSGSDNGKLRLVKDGDKYVFTSAPADTDARESFDIFIYRTIIDTDVQESEK